MAVAAITPTNAETETRRTRAWPRNKLAAGERDADHRAQQRRAGVVPMSAIAPTPRRRERGDR